MLALAVLAVLVPPVIFDLVSRPTIRRLGLRNATRRLSEAALVVGGSMLATALIVASLLIGDSFGSSVRGQVSTVLGPIDQIVSPEFSGAPETAAESVPSTPWFAPVSTAQQPSAAPPLAPFDALTANNDGTFDGLLPVAYGDFAAGGVGANATIVGSLQLVELEPAKAKLFGGDPAATGLVDLPGSLGATGVALNVRSAQALRVEVGDQIQVFVGDGSQVLDVAVILDRQGLAGFGDMLVGPGTITAHIVNAGAIIPAVLISNDGDDEGGAELTAAASALVVDVLGPETSILTVKQDLLDDADAQSSEMTELFGTIGGFSVVAGILLLVNLFMMLAAERRKELGTMQALGLDRRQLSRSFSLEGFVYGVAAALGGTLLGVGVAAVVLRFASRLLESDGDVSLSLFVEPLSLLTGAAAGLAISQLTVVLTSARITRLSIVNAMKGLAEPANRRSSGRAVTAGVVVVVLAVLAMVFVNDVDIILLLGPVAIVLGAIPFVSQFLNPRRVAVLSALLALGVSGGAFAIWGDRLDEPELNFFLVQGVLFVGLGALVLASMNGTWMSLLSRFRACPPAVRLGLAHPLDRPGRTGLLVTMYALVIFTVTFMAVLNAVFQQQVPKFAEQIGGGFAAVVDSNPTDPFTTTELQSRDSIDVAVPVLQGDLEYTYVDGDGDVIEDYWYSSTVPENYPADLGPRTVERSVQFADDVALWAAVAHSDDWIVVPGYAEFAVGDQLEVQRRDGATKTVEVAAITDLNYAADAGFYVPAAFGPWLVDGVDVVSRHYLHAADGVSANDLVDELNIEIERGASARTFIELAQADVDEQQAFIRLLQGYLAIGLLIGLAGLGVVLARAVRERRQQLGVLGAIGLDASVLRNVFIIEAAFIGAQGVMLGIGLGLASAWLVVTRSTAFAAGLGFAAPAFGLAALGVASFFAAIAAGAIPARHAGRVSPAMALRLDA